MREGNTSMTNRFAKKAAGAGYAGVFRGSRQKPAYPRSRFAAQNVKQKPLGAGEPSRLLDSSSAPRARRGDGSDGR